MWEGNYYALEVTTRLGLEVSGGMEVVGPVHYNTEEETKRFGAVLGRITEILADIQLLFQTVADEITTQTLQLVNYLGAVSSLERMRQAIRVSQRDGSFF